MTPQRIALSASRTLGVALGLFALTLASPADAAQLALRLLSSAPDKVAGGDALVELTGSAGAGATTLLVNGAPAHQVRQDTGPRGERILLIDGLKPGRNVISARSGPAHVSLTVVNHPLSGPILPGTAIPLLSCMTQESGLGAATDADCSAPTKIEYFYRTTAGAFRQLPGREARPSDLASVTRDGAQAPYIVRVESGVVDRSIYRIAVLDDPAQVPADVRAWRPSKAWNGRLVVFFGGGCGAHYAQGGDTVDAVLSDLELSRGYAYAVSPTLVNQQFCSPLIQGEALMMIKQHFIKAYGPPVWTLGSGASGGSIQQLAIAEMFPGLLDAIQPGASFPDSQLQPPSDCQLLATAYARNPQRWTQPMRDAVNGATASTCADWGQTFAHNFETAPGPKDLTSPLTALVESAGHERIPTPFACDVRDTKRLYDETSNPGGLACSQYDMQANQLGHGPDGRGLRPFDNVGVQYGLAALNAGAITIDDFLDLNAQVGGYDRDGRIVAERSQGDVRAIRNAYATGLQNGGGGGLSLTPIIALRNYMDTLPAGSAAAIHDRLEDFVIRARLSRANGSADNQVILTTGARSSVDLRVVSLDLASRWLDAMTADPAPNSLRKVVANKPADAVDTCWTPAGDKIVEPADLAATSRCNQLYPLHGEPRMVAGEGLTNDIAKCQLRAPRRADYPATMTSAQFARLTSVFPAGVCDYTLPGVGFSPFRDPLFALSADAEVRR